MAILYVNKYVAVCSITVIYLNYKFCDLFSEKELAKSGQLKENTEIQYSKITELEERYHHKMHVAKVRRHVWNM